MCGCAREFFERTGRGGGGDQGEAGSTGGAGTMRVSQRQKCQTTPHATRTGRRGQPAEQAAGSGRHTAESRQQATGSRRQAAHGRKRAAGGQQSVGQAAASRIEKISCTYKQPATAARCTHRHGGSPGHRESEIASEPCRLGSGKNHAGKQVLSTEIPEILRIREIQRMFTNYHKKRAEKSCILKIYV